MAKMKESGIGLIGLIPEDWKVTKLKYEFVFGKGLPITKDNLIDEGLPVISYGQIHSKLNNGTSINPILLRYVKPYYKFTNPQSKVFKGDFIFADTSEDLEGCGNAVLKCNEDELFAGYHSIIMHAKKPEYSKYMAYLFLTNEWRNQLRSRVSGVKVFSVTQSIFKFTSIILPPIETQKLIAGFLDNKCAKIDSLRNDIQKQIEVLEQYKKSVITEAVTKGINPDVKMKDSGIEWIGEIPEHWEVKHIGQIYVERRQKVSDRDYPPLSVTMKGILPQLETAAKSDAHDDRKLVCKGDFAINSRSDRRGSCGISPYDGSISLINTVLTPLGEMNPVFYNWLFHTPVFADEFYKNGHGIVDDLWTTSWQEMKRIAIQIPPLNEQKEIADYLDSKCASINEIIKKKQQQLETLEEYKKSLIFEYVTGKKEVC